MDGYISEISVSIPWKSLLNDSSFVEVKGLAFTVQPKQRAESGMHFHEYTSNYQKFVLSLFQN